MRRDEGDPIHSILDRSWEYEVVGLRLEREPLDEAEPYLDLTVKSGSDRRVLRFWSPQDLEVERGGPCMTSGLMILDIRARGLEKIGVRVDDLEGGSGSMRFVARAVEEIGTHAVHGRS
jgi:hypothetical protein